MRDMPEQAPILQACDLPEEFWLTRVAEVVSTEMLQQNGILIPITEHLVRRWARKQGLLLERLRGGRGYRLWDLADPATEAYPIDLTAESEFVDCLEGIAIFLSYAVKGPLAGGGID